MQKIFYDTKNKIFFKDAGTAKWMIAFLKILSGSGAR
jgi:hypothetical protein